MIERMSGYELEPKKVDLFAVFDLDRTLFNTGAYLGVLCEPLRESYGDDAVNDFIREVEEKEGSSIPPGKAIEDRFSGVDVDQLRDVLYQRIENDDEYKQKLKDILIFSGADELLDMFSHHGVVTYGEDEEQIAKLRLFAKLTGRESLPPHMVVKVNNKSGMVESEWPQLETGGLLIPQELTKGEKRIAAYTIVVFDDKTIHLKTDRMDIIPVLINNSLDTEDPNSYSLIDVATKLAGKYGDALDSAVRSMRWSNVAA